jgi:peptidoglycan-N-acetylglucosamine deacetylase
VSVETADPVVAFTFDDGPDPECTPQVLDTLRSRGATATFFVLGEAARRSPELVRRAVAEGHEIGLHGQSHRPMTEIPVTERARSVVDGRRETARAAGRRADWFRAPYGKQTLDTVLLSRLLGMRPVMWSAYAREWEDHPIDWCADHAADAMSAGAILLLHDGAAGTTGRSREPDAIVALLESLLTVAEERGLGVVTVGELVRRGRPRRRLWFRDWKV